MIPQAGFAAVPAVPADRYRFGTGLGTGGTGTGFGTLRYDRQYWVYGLYTCFSDHQLFFKCITHPNEHLIHYHITNFHNFKSMSTPKFAPSLHIKEVSLIKPYSVNLSRN